MSSKVLIKTAFSSHTFCFICKRNANHNNLYQIKLKSRIKAYENHRIYIKRYARICARHLDDNRELREEEYERIPTKTIYHDVEIKTMLELMIMNNKSKSRFIFEAFKDFEKMDEIHCQKVTGWTKDEFSEFAGYITSIKNTKGRCLEQLIALYRYWLRKGTDQTTLSYLFGRKVSQNKISEYLEQIRDAIKKDFVPFFLGARKGRDFFLRHNNKMTKKLHELSKDTLAIVADGTYCRIEKSANNQLQYLSWSEQKQDSLIKPFGICCTDGYFIDCFGPFQANFNDAQILEYIFENDEDFRKLCLDGKTIAFLDRAFRDIKNVLKEKYEVISFIPSTRKKQKKNKKSETFALDDKEKKKMKQLTIKETNHNRLVSKSRFVIEKQFGNLKKFRALDNIRNTLIGHIQIDYRIACAMINFNHKICCPDKDNVDKIAKKLKKRFKIKNNELECLLTKHLNTKGIPEVNLDIIDDFPKLSSSNLQSNIFLGSFQIKECRKYLKEIIENGKAYFVSNQIKNRIDIENIQDYKLIAVEITSRHKRSENKSKNSSSNNQTRMFKTNYKVFILYQPGEDTSKSIKNYICNCMSGRKVAGCCVHVASVIYYLSYARFKNLKLPALDMHLVLVDTKKRQRPNDPRHVKIKRSKNNHRMHDSESDTSSSIESEDELSRQESNLDSQSNTSENDTDENDTDENETDENDSDEDDSDDE